MVFIAQVTVYDRGMQMIFGSEDSESPQPEQKKG